MGRVVGGNAGERGVIVYLEYHSSIRPVGSSDNWLVVFYGNALGGMDGIISPSSVEGVGFPPHSGEIDGREGTVTIHKRKRDFRLIPEVSV